MILYKLGKLIFKIAILFKNKTQNLKFSNFSLLLHAGYFSFLLQILLFNKYEPCSLLVLLQLLMYLQFTGCPDKINLKFLLI